MKNPKGELPPFSLPDNAIDVVTLSKEEQAKKELRELLKARTVQFDDPKPEHVYCLRMGGQPLASLGNIGVVAGKAKSRKSFLVSSLVAALFRGEYLNFESSLPSGKTGVLYIDTEQGEYHVWQLVQGIVGMSAKESHPQGLQVIRTRGMHPETIVNAVDLLLEESNNIGVMIIDGVRDLLYDINNPEECTRISTKLLAWSQDYNIHISTILHENKGNALLRGHIGTELTNKAEYVLNVKYIDETISEVFCDTSREQRPEPFAFAVNEARQTEIVADHVFSTEKSNTPKRGISFNDYDQQTHKNLLAMCYKHSEQYSKTKLIDQLAVELDRVTGEKVGKNKLRSWVDEYEKVGHIVNLTPSKQSATYALKA